MNTSHSSHRLLIDDGSGSPAWTHAHDVDVLIVPRGESRLHRDGKGRPQLLPGDAPTDDAIRLDAVDDRHLLLAVPAGASLRLNGAPAPRLTRLRPADRLDLPGGPTLHVSRERSGAPIAPPSDLVGELCGLCRVPLTATTRVWICGDCGGALHLEGDEIPEDRRLTCARLASACPVCQGPVEHGTGGLLVPAR